DRRKQHCDSVAFTPDGKSLAIATTNRSVAFFDLATGAEQFPPLDTGVQPIAISLSPSGKKLALLEGKNLRIWSVGERRELMKLSHQARLTIGAWHPDERLFAAGDFAGAVVLFDLSTGEGQICRGHSQYIGTITYEPHGEVFSSVGWDGGTRFWDGLTGNALFATRQGLLGQF